MNDHGGSMLNHLVEFTRKNKQKVILTAISIAGISVLVTGLSSINKKDTIENNISIVNDTIQENDENYALAGNDAMNHLIDNYKELEALSIEGYQLTIGDVVLTVKSVEDVEKVLELVQQGVVGQEVETSVNVYKTSGEFVVETEIIPRPKLQIMANEVGLSTSSGTSSDLTPELSANITVLPVKIENSYLFMSDNQIVPLVDEKITEDDKSLDEITNLEFDKEIQIAKVNVAKEDIVSVDEAVALLNKTNEEPETYEVEQGDVPSIIANKNDMKLSELYKLNEGLEENPTKLQIGESLIVMKPTPVLSVVVEEKIVYYDTIPKETIYINNPDEFEGTDVTTEYGFDGTMEVTAIVKTENGDEISKEIVSEVIVTEPKSAVVYRGTKEIPPKAAKGYFIAPVKSYRITSMFGSRWGGFHTGVDLATSTGSTVRASDGGVVTEAGWSGGYGYLVVIDHKNGYVTKYGHNSKILVKVGQEVAQDEIIAKSGSTGNSTGPHVHFEIIKNGQFTNPLKLMNK